MADYRRLGRVRPPLLARWLLRCLAARTDREFLLGDLEEVFYCEVLPVSGRRAARGWYWRQAFEVLQGSHVPKMRRDDGEKHGGSSMNRLARDIRFGLRSLRRNPGFAAVVLLTLALGIGANTTVFSVVNNLVLNPFSFPEGDNLVGIGPAFPKLGGELRFWEVLSPAEYLDIRSRSRSLTKVVSWDMGNRQVAGEGTPENVFSGFWWGDAFDTLRVTPAAGRGFTLEETVRGDPVAIISHRFWQRRFGSDPGIVGKVIHVNGNPYTLVGIMPQGTLIYGTDLWIPMGAAPERFQRGRRQFQVLARIAPGHTLREVNVELETIARAVELEHGGEFKEYSGWKLVAETWTRINTQMLRPAGLILTFAVGFVMLLICANIASLFLARGVRRQQELGVRAALGASRSRIMTQLLTEGVLMSVLGGILGLGLALAAIQWIASTISSIPFPIAGQVGMNSRVMLFTACLSALVGLIFGSVPAWKITRSNIHDILKGEGKSSTEGAGKQRLQSVLVGAEVSLAFILLMGGGLLVKSLIRLQAVDTGFQPKNILTMRLTLPREEYNGPQITAFFGTLVERLEGIPGVVKASAASQFPPQVFSSQQLQIEGMGVKSQGELPSCYATLATEGYFESLGIPMLRGRGFTNQDRVNTPMVAVINDVVARRYFAGQDPLGKRIKAGRPASDQPWIEVVGVARSTQNRGLDIPPQPEVFVSIRQAEGWWNQLFLLIRTEVEPMSVVAAVRKEVASLDPDQPVYAIQTVEDAYAASMAQRNVASTMLSAFALFALILAAVGVFSVVSFRIAARTREIGLRMAMGATMAQVRRLVVRQAMVPVAAGAAVGLPAALLMGNMMQDLLFRVTGTDGATIAGAAFILGSAALLASWVPAYRASRRDPLDTLRHE